MQVQLSKSGLITYSEADLMISPAEREKLIYGDTDHGYLLAWAQSDDARGGTNLSAILQSVLDA